CSSAAFRRLCVETGVTTTTQRLYCQPPSGGCVLKQACFVLPDELYYTQPPSGGCVLKHKLETKKTNVVQTSRPRAAVC
ncbi:MAG: hypothetical protein D8H97_13120, partial [Neisseria sp.]